MLQRYYFARYEKMAKKMLRFRENPPLKLVQDFQNALHKLREHLHQNGIIYPVPKYPIIPGDPTTSSHIENPIGEGAIANPNYKYRDIWRRVDGLRGIY